MILSLFSYLYKDKPFYEYVFPAITFGFTEHDDIALGHIIHIYDWITYWTSFFKIYNANIMVTVSLHKFNPQIWAVAIIQ